MEQIGVTVCQRNNTDETQHLITAGSKEKVGIGDEEQLLI